MDLSNRQLTVRVELCLQPQQKREARSTHSLFSHQLDDRIHGGCWSQHSGMSVVQSDLRNGDYPPVVAYRGALKEDSSEMHESDDKRPFFQDWF